MGNDARRTFNYLRRHYFDDSKLKELALLEFVRAMRGGRLIAFTGSMTTKQYGYPRWGALLAESLDEAASLLEKGDQRDLISAFKNVARKERHFDARVAFSAASQMLDHKDTSGARTAMALIAIAKKFTASNRPREAAPDIISALFGALHVDRVVTTNYDLELECQAMGIAPDAGDPLPWDVAKTIEEWREQGRFYRGGTREEGYSLILNAANGDRIVSDMMLRERPEALIEFAIGCPENDRHIFHLHGRADVSREMVLSYRDYDRLYRRHGLSKLPFEHALRMLFAGNPVLFVGLGMSEPELNQTLSEFVGDHPYLRKSPAFLIWNTPSGIPAESGRHGAVSAAQRKAVFRLDMLHRLGILTIFSDELPKTGRSSGPSDVSNLRKALLGLVTHTVDAQRKRLQKVPNERWRHALKRIRRAYNSGDLIINTWNVGWTADGNRVFPEARVHQSSFIRLLVRPDGSSKTALAMALAQKWISRDTNRLAVILNFNMRIDTDSILAFIADLLRFNEKWTDKRNSKRENCRQAEFKETVGLKDGRSLLIVLKGLERIFDGNGHPLSAEFDDFLRIMAARGASIGDELKNKLHIAIIGTERVSPYFEGLDRAYLDTVEIERMAPTEAAAEGSDYLRKLAKEYKFGPLELAKLESRRLADYSAKRRVLYRGILTPEALKSKRIDEPDLALELITVMSYIGQPIERAALFHAPVIQDRLNCPDETIHKRRKRFSAAFDRLVEAGLIKEINQRSGSRPDERRYAVHLSLQTEIRDRKGIPLSDSILSTAYNMSLFSAQPADGALPEAEVHDELGRLVDWMAGAHKDRPFDRLAPDLDKGDSVAEVRAAPHVAAALRAAVSLVRGLYSTSALLSVDRGSRLIAEEREGLLGEHAQRLERILSAFDKMWRARVGVVAGAEPLYPDEVVWLHNERGVVKLAQGDLYEARFSFSEADRINRECVEFEDCGHNWRRITLNQIVVDIERGKLQSAEGRMAAIERQLKPGKARHIRDKYLDNIKCVRRVRFDEMASHEDILSMALITGYRGLISHLRGELDAARINFERAIRVLQRMDEQRALALFRRHKASIHGDLNEIEQMRRESRLAVSGAESVRQLDIVYASRLIEACIPDEKGTSDERRAALRASLEALDYATLADMHRLSIEAQARLAWINFHAGDYDSALNHITEAMATATRYGMTLYKISLRIQMGRILTRRGNIDAGKTLIQNAINGAIRIGYQRAIIAARQVLSEGGSPTSGKQ